MNRENHPAKNNVKTKDLPPFPSPLKTGLFSLTAIVAGIVIVEVLLRAVLFNYPYVGKAIFLTQLDLPEVHSLHPGSAGGVAGSLGDLMANADYYDINIPNRPYRVVSNNVGIRRKTDVSPEKPDDTFRIYCLGDSYTFGPFVANEDTYPSILEKLLAKRRPDMKFEVLNGGIPGYFMRQEADLFISKGFRSDPDLVILQVLDNDVQGYMLGQYQYPRPENASDGIVGGLKNIFRAGSERFAIFKLAREALLRWVAWRGGVQIRPRSNQPENQAGDEGNVINPDQKRDQSALSLWTDRNKLDMLKNLQKLNENDFDKLVNFINERGIALMVVYFPTQRALEWSRGGIDRAVEYYITQTKKRKLEFLDLTPYFTRVENTHPLYLWPWNGHLSLLGNHAAAKAMIGAVEGHIRKQ